MAIVDLSDTSLPPLQPPGTRGLAVGVRAGLLLLCAALQLSSDPLTKAAWLVPVAAMAALALTQPAVGLRGRLCRIAETAVTALAVVQQGDPSSPLLPYLLAPALLGGFTVGIEGAVVAPAVGALILLVGATVVRRPDAGLRQYAISAGEWVVLAATVGLVAGWCRRVLLETPATSDRSVLDAHRLLSQLRLVARRLPGGLDPDTIAEGLLASLHDRVPHTRSAVLVQTTGDRLVPLAFSGADRIDWSVSLLGSGPFAEAWSSQQAQWRNRQLTLMPNGPRGRVGSSVVLPLRAGARTFGMVGLEDDDPDALGQGDLAVLQRAADEVSLRLETALLFDEVRRLATQEERRRLAREIHDGIAQELAAMGYALDGLAAVGDPTSRDIALSLRAEMTRLVHELRMSIFELRNDVDRHGGLGAALSEYVRSVGKASTLTVHTTLDEAPLRLPAPVEAEVLRVAQEAIGNARKHSCARNLWVSLTVLPPYARLVISDDGVGIPLTPAGQPQGRDGGYGLQSMRERAALLRGTLEVGPRSPRGTTVELIVRASTRGGSTPVPDGHDVTGQDTHAPAGMGSPGGPPGAAPADGAVPGASPETTVPAVGGSWEWTAAAPPATTGPRAPGVR